MEYRSMIVPTKYFQGRGLIGDFYERTKHLGKNFAFVVDDIVYEVIRDKVYDAFDGTDGKYMYIFHSGESTLAEALRIATILRENRCDVVVGVGGGKVIDSAKLAGMQIDGMKTVIMPTSAASDAPCSANTVIYDEEGSFIKAEKPKENPSVVLVDTEIISKAPIRLLIAGMGDAFATYYEARASKCAGLKNLSGGLSTLAGYEIAKLCRDTLLQYGEIAKNDVLRGECTEALEKVIEANIYLSGVGFENNGVSIAHATYNGLTDIFTNFPVLHGEGVAFGLLVQLAVEYNESKSWNDGEWNDVVNFYKSVGLPTKFSDILIKDANDILLLRLAKSICVASVNAYREPFEVTPQKIFTALKQIRDTKL